MIDHVEDLKPGEEYTLISGQEKFKDGVVPGFKVVRYKHLNDHGGIEGKPVIKVMMISNDEEAKRELPYRRLRDSDPAMCYQKLHQHWIDNGIVKIK